MRDVERLEAMRFKSEFKVEDLESFKKLENLEEGDREKAMSDLKELCIEWQVLLAAQGELSTNLDSPPSQESTILFGDSDISRIAGSDPSSGEELRKQLEDVVNPYLDQKKRLQASGFLKGLYRYSSAVKP